MSTMLYLASDKPNPAVWGLLVEHAVFAPADVETALDEGWSRDPRQVAAAPQEAPADPPEPGSREHMASALLAAFIKHVDSLTDEQMADAFANIPESGAGEPETGARRGRKPKADPKAEPAGEPETVAEEA